MTDLPCHKCGGFCCGIVPFENSLIQDLTQLGYIRRGIVSESMTATTSLLIREGVPLLEQLDNKCIFYDTPRRGCAIYDRRPQVCRIYGEEEALPCAYLHPDKAMKKLNEMIKRNKK